MHRLPPPPALPRPSSRPPFPFIAVVAPLVGAVVIGLLTRSPFVLVFALLSPLVAIATTVDGRRVARRHDRDEAERFDRECAAYSDAIDRAHAAERARADARSPLIGAPSATDGVRLGVAPAVSSCAPDESLPLGDSDDERRVSELLVRARRHPALPVLVPRGVIAVLGSGMVADALARRLDAEEGVEVMREADARHASAGVTVVLVYSASCIEVTVCDADPVLAIPEFVSARQIVAIAAKRSHSVVPKLPDSVSWRALRGAATDAQESPVAGVVAEAGLSSAVTIGIDATGPVIVDLERDGPHALVGGTTGSGKSEFLRTLALGWAADRSPREVQLLFVDFKGGATFAGLTELPHSVGLVTDLDPLIAERTLRSLRAELRRRERVLAEQGLRDIAQQPAVLSRLVVLVDEFAAVMESFPDLHSAFADLSARGRSLGLHLVLCTQNPAGVVRDAVATNCAVRIAFRLDASAGSAFMGTQGRDLFTAGPGRAKLTYGDVTREIQVAVIDDSDIESVKERWSGHSADRSAWPPPLPSMITPDQLDAFQQQQLPSKALGLGLAPHRPSGSGSGSGTDGDAVTAARPECATTVLVPLRFGLLDDPAEQRQVPAVWRPARDGGLAVIGASRSGRTSCLAAFEVAARRAGAATVVLPSSAPEAWALLEQCTDSPVPGLLLIADDLDLLLADSADLASDLLARWDSAARAIRRSGGAVIASMGSTAAVRSLFTGRFESRLMLRSADADDHALVGAPRGMYDRHAPPGRGWWADQHVQVVFSDASTLVPTRARAPEWHPPVDTDVIVVTRRPAKVCEVLHHAYPSRRIVRDISAEAVAPSVATAEVIELAPRTLVGDPDTWQSAWPLFTALRRRAPIVAVHADGTDLRLLIAHRSTPPPLEISDGDVWVVEPGEPLERRRWRALATG